MIFYMYLPLFVVFVLVYNTLCPFWFCNHLDEEERAGCFASSYVPDFFGAVFASKGYPFKDIFDFTTAGDWDSVGRKSPCPSL